MGQEFHNFQTSFLPVHQNYGFCHHGPLRVQWQAYCGRKYHYKGNFIPEPPYATISKDQLWTCYRCFSNTWTEFLKLFFYYIGDLFHEVFDNGVLSLGISTKKLRKRKSFFTNLSSHMQEKRCLKTHMKFFLIEAPNKYLRTLFIQQQYAALPLCMVINSVALVQVRKSYLRTGILLYSLWKWAENLWQHFNKKR